jgi:hypothetical protein
MNKELEQAIEKAAQDVMQFVENAMGDFSFVDVEDLASMGKKYSAKAKEMKKDGADDILIRECIAEMMYEDKYILHDMAGDRIYDAAGEIYRHLKLTDSTCKKTIRRRIMEKIKELSSHRPMREAMDMLIEMTKDFEPESVKQFEDKRRSHLKDGYWACGCGNKTFYLVQQKENVKSICFKCGSMDIIYWNGIGDSSAGSMRRLDTDKWIKPVVTIQFKEK